MTIDFDNASLCRRCLRVNRRILCTLAVPAGQSRSVMNSRRRPRPASCGRDRIRSTNWSRDQIGKRSQGDKGETTIHAHSVAKPSSSNQVLTVSRAQTTAYGREIE